MPKLNGVLMVLLSAAVIGALGWRVLGQPDDGAAARAREARVLRKLADPDPDLRREAEAELKSMGARGQELLRETAKGPDVRLAERAAAVLQAWTPAAGDAPAVAEPESLLACVDGFKVQFLNSGVAPLLIALEKKGEESRFAAFEIVDGRGNTHTLPAASYAPPVVDGPAHLVVLPPGGRQVLYEGTGVLEAALRALPGPCKVRFVYDASEGSPYREVVRVSDRGVPLKPARYAADAQIP